MRILARLASEIAKFLFGAQESSITFLGCVAVIVEPSHKDHAIDDHFPFVGEHFLDLGPKYTWFGIVLSACLFRCNELFGFWEDDSKSLEALGIATQCVSRHPNRRFRFSVAR